MLMGVAKKIVLACVVSIAAASVGTAVAADLPVDKTPVRPAAAAPAWSGFYAGGNIGYGWDSGSSGLPISTTDPLLAGFVAFLATSGSYPDRMSPSAHGAIGGGQAGYNWQLQPRWLAGIEADLQGASIKGTDTQARTPFGLDATSTSLSKSIGWFGTVRGRVGFLIDPQWLLYATGGLAYGETKLGFGTITTTSACVVNATICANGASSSVRAGWTVGAGVEAMLAQNWSFKAEYLYIDLGRQSVNFLAYTAPIIFSPSADFHEQIARVGLNYHFN